MLDHYQNLIDHLLQIYTTYNIQIKLQQNYYFTCSLIHNIEIKYKIIHKLTGNQKNQFGLT